jgi:hypothetical protein
MALIDDLLAIDNRLALGGAKDYDAVLADEAIVIVPGSILDKRACVAAMAESPGWETVELDVQHLIHDETVAHLVYRFHGLRGDTHYRAVLSSTYRLSDRKLILHQHTPEPEE